MSKRIQVITPTEPELTIWSIIWVDDVFGEMLNHLSIIEELYFKSTCKALADGHQSVLRYILIHKIVNTFSGYSIFSMRLRNPKDVEKYANGPYCCLDYFTDLTASEEEDEEKRERYRLKICEKERQTRIDACIKYDTFLDTQTLISVCSDLKTILGDTERVYFVGEVELFMKSLLVKRLFLDSLCIIK